MEDVGAISTGRARRAAWNGPPWETAPRSRSTRAARSAPARTATTRLTLALLLEGCHGAACSTSVAARRPRDRRRTPWLWGRDRGRHRAPGGRGDRANRRSERRRRRGHAARRSGRGAGRSRRDIALAAVEALALRLQAERLVVSGFPARERPQLEGFRRTERRQLGTAGQPSCIAADRAAGDDPRRVASAPCYPSSNASIFSAARSPTWTRRRCERLLADGHVEGEALPKLCGISTCCVTNEALNATPPRARARTGAFDVTGCAANLAEGSFAGLPANVTVVVKRAEETAEFGAGDVGAIGCVHAESRLDRVRAFVKIQDGCSFSCAFCVIPLVRGSSRSRSAEDVLREVRRRVRQGHVGEVVHRDQPRLLRDRGRV